MIARMAEQVEWIRIWRGERLVGEMWREGKTVASRGMGEVVDGDVAEIRFRDGRVDRAVQKRKKKV